MGRLAFRDYISLIWLGGGGCALKRVSKTFLVLQSMHLTVNKTASSTSCIGQIYKYMLLSIVEILLQDLWRVPIQLHSLTFSCICTNSLRSQAQYQCCFGNMPILPVQIKMHFIFYINSKKTSE